MRFRLSVTITIILAMLASASWAASPSENWRLIVTNAAAVHSDVVTVEDIARPHGDMDQAQWDNLRKIRLFRAPKPGSKRLVVTKRGLHAVLGKALGPLSAFCVVPDRLTVQRGGKVLDRENIKKRIVDFLTPAFMGQGEVEFKNFHLPEFIFLSDSFDKLELDPGQSATPGRNTIRLTVRGPGGQTIRQAVATVFVNLWAPVACASRPINRTDVVTPSMITFKRKNMAYVTDAWDGKGGPWRVKRPIGAGQIISKDNLEPMPSIRRGDKITLTFQGKFVRLAVDAEALEDGKIGETISVRNVQSQRKVMAVVADSETVIIRR